MINKKELDDQVFMIFINNYYQAITNAMKLYSQVGLDIDKLNSFKFEENIMKLGITVVSAFFILES